MTCPCAELGRKFSRKAIDLFTFYLCWKICCWSFTAEKEVVQSYKVLLQNFFEVNNYWRNFIAGFFAPEMFTGEEELRRKFIAEALLENISWRSFTGEVENYALSQDTCKSLYIFYYERLFPWQVSKFKCTIPKQSPFLNDTCMMPCRTISWLISFAANNSLKRFGSECVYGIRGHNWPCQKVSSHCTPSLAQSCRWVFRANK